MELKIGIDQVDSSPPQSRSEVCGNRKKVRIAIGLQPIITRLMPNNDSKIYFNWHLFAGAAAILGGDVFKAKKWSQ